MKKIKNKELEDEFIPSKNGVLEQAKIMKPFEGKIDIKKINRGFRRKIVINCIRDKMRKFRM